MRSKIIHTIGSIAALLAVLTIFFSIRPEGFLRRNEAAVTKTEIEAAGATVTFIGKKAGTDIPRVTGAEDFMARYPFEQFTVEPVNAVPTGVYELARWRSSTAVVGHRTRNYSQATTNPLRRLSESEMTWLKNLTHDHRPEVKSLACMVYAQRFPRQARNQKKQELSIQTLNLNIDGDICDPYGDSVYIKESYQVSRTPPAIVRIQRDGAPQTVWPPPKILAKLLKWTVHMLEIFWWGEDYCGPADVEPEDAEYPLWSVHVEYSNGEVQDMESADDPPDQVLELVSALAEFFE